MAGSSSRTIASLVTNNKAGSTTKKPVEGAVTPDCRVLNYSGWFSVVSLQSALSFLFDQMPPVSSAGPLPPIQDRIQGKLGQVRSTRCLSPRSFTDVSAPAL